MVKPPLPSLLSLAFPLFCLAAPTPVPDPVDLARQRLSPAPSCSREELPKTLAAQGLGESEAVLLALSLHPDLEAARARRRAAGGSLTGARLKPNPELGVEAEEAEPGANLGGSTFNIVLRQQLLAGGRYGRRIQAARRSVEVADWDVFLAGVQLAAETREAFLQVLAARELLEISWDQEGVAEELGLMVSKRLKAGAANLTEELRAQAFVSEVETQRLRAQARLEAAEARLRGLLVSLPPRVPWKGELPASHPPPSFEAVLSLVQASPHLTRLEAAQRAAAAGLSAAQAQRHPNWTVGLGVRRNRILDDTSYLASFGVPLPVSNRNQGGIESSRAREDEARARREGARLRLEARCRGLLATLGRLHEQVETFREGVLPRTRKALELSRIGYQRGKFLYIQVLDAQRELVTALRRELELRLEYARTQVTLESLLGYPGESHLGGRP